LWHVQDGGVFKLLIEVRAARLLLQIANVTSVWLYGSLICTWSALCRDCRCKGIHAYQRKRFFECLPIREGIGRLGAKHVDKLVVDNWYAEYNKRESYFYKAWVC
jgi:hypothetical protein